MNIDKNLFLYDLAVVSIMKNAAPYVKEWVDYHLLAGVDHFFIYDNDSEDNFKEVLQPYVDAGLVTYIFYSGKHRMLEAYTDALHEFGLYCRYMSFIDDDEFILPKSKPTIPEVIDEVLIDKPGAAALSAHWQFYGASGLEKADYSRGVLDRFTHRSENVNVMVKTTVNPRRIRFFVDPHNPMYCYGYRSVNEVGQTVEGSVDGNGAMADKIVVNHYHTKSLEEYILRKGLTDANFGYTIEKQVIEERFRNSEAGSSEVFDNSILKYRDGRLAMLVPNGSDLIETFAKLKQLDFDRLVNALVSNVLPGVAVDNAKLFFDSRRNQRAYSQALKNFQSNVPKEFFKGRIGTSMTCLAISTFLKDTYLDEELGNLLEEFSLMALCKSFRAGFSMADLQLLIQKMPTILTLPYPVVNEIRAICQQFIPAATEALRTAVTNPAYLHLWREIHELNYILKLLQTFDSYRCK